MHSVECLSCHSVMPESALLIWGSLRLDERRRKAHDLAMYFRSKQLSRREEALKQRFRDPREDGETLLAERNALLQERRDLTRRASQ